MTDFSRILSKLADNGPIRLDELQRDTGYSPDQLKRYVNELRSSGLQLIEADGELCWRSPTPLLNAKAIQAGLGSESGQLAGAPEVFFSLDSTNSFLLNHAGEDAGTRICLAETQTSGRGRRGRCWISPPCSNIYLSISLRFPVVMDALSGLSLGVGVVIAEELSRDIAEPLGLKWPNDLYVGGRKLGGILVELKRINDSAIHVVIGIGLNVHAHAQSDQIDQPWISLDQCVKPGVELNRNDWVSRLLNVLMPFLTEYPEKGGRIIQRLWPKYDLCLGQPVSIQTGSSVFTGLGAGIDADFNFLLERGQRLEPFSAAEVSLRIQDKVNEADYE